MSIKILEHFDMAKYFTRICGAATDRSRNTKEAVIAYLLEETGEAGNMVMVGDTVYDVMGAKVLGIPCIGVSWGYGAVTEMQEAGAAAIVNTMEELLTVLKA
jgi:phosphoglycolate phosphatase